MVLVDGQHQAVMDDFKEHFEKHLSIGPGMYTALLGNFLGRMEYYVTEGSDIPAEDFSKMIEENRKLGLAFLKENQPNREN